MRHSRGLLGIQLFDLGVETPQALLSVNKRMSAQVDTTGQREGGERGGGYGDESWEIMCRRGGGEGGGSWGTKQTCNCFLLSANGLFAYTTFWAAGALCGVPFIGLAADRLGLGFGGFGFGAGVGVLALAPLLPPVEAFGGLAVTSTSGTSCPAAAHPPVSPFSFVSRAKGRGFAGGGSGCYRRGSSSCAHACHQQTPDLAGETRGGQAQERILSGP